MPNQGQTLDQIFSTQAPTSPTASTSGAGGQAQSLESIFGNTNTQTSARPSLDSIFSAKPSTSTTPPDRTIGDVGNDIVSNVNNDFNQRIAEKNQTEQDYSDGKIGLAHAVFQSIGNIVGGAFSLPMDVVSGLTKGSAGASAVGAISDVAGKGIDFASKPLADALASPEIATLQNASALYQKAGDLYHQAHLETDPAKQRRGIELADNVKKAADAISGTAKEISSSQASASRDASSAVNLGTLAIGGASPETAANVGAAGKALATEAGDITSDVGTLAGKALSPANDALGNVISKTGDIASNLKEKIVPSTTLDQTVGQVAQGGADEIPTFTKGLSNLDTTGIKTYKDLTKKADDTIKTEAKAQDTALAANETPLKVQQMAIKVGSQEAAHNYVLDAVQQLKDYFTKTNDIANLAKVNNYITKLDPIKGEGLTVKEINDIARMHGTNLNAYNANGELASGLTKQAAENTRQGLKQTVVQNIKDPAMQAAFKASDAKMSSLYTVRDLSGKMAEKVNTLTQRLQKPNILQKLGSIIGKVGRISGVGDIAQKLLGIEKTPGASTLNAVELQARLQKNLAKINEALGKNDTGFVKDVESMLQDDNLSNSKANETQQTANTTNQKANVGDNAQSIKNNSNQTISKDNTTFEPKSKTGQLIQKAIQTYQETPNKQGGFARVPSSIRDIADTQRDATLSKLNKVDSGDFLNSKGYLNMEALQKYDEIMAKFEKGTDTPEDVRTANEILGLLKK